MAELAGAYTQIFIMLVIVVVGYVATKLGYITKAGFSSINSLLIHIALPCMIIASVASLDPSTGAQQVPWFFVMAFAQFMLLIVEAYALNALLRVPEVQRPIYLFGNICTNTGFLCLPIIAAVYGSQTVLGSSIYVLMCNLFLGTMGIAVLQAGDPTRREPGRQASGLKLHFHPRMLWNAPLVACVFALFLFFTGLRLPEMVDTTIATIGGICVPLAMMVVGSALAQTDMKSVFTDIRLYAYTFIRQLVVPAASYVLLARFIADPTLIWVFVIMFAAPVGVMAPAWVDNHHQDGTFAARLTVISTLASFVFIPLLVTLMGLA
ncbi:MAG: AEC family transporter [Coriobacteriaceae bacterium]|nr:AEC family transporter [Coriobacteriaceae bacterium]